MTPTPQTDQPSTAARFWAKVDRGSQPRDCWRWFGATMSGDRGGYGQFLLNGESVLAHRLAYELTVGPIPEGLTLDHLCRNRWCVRPDHLEPVTNRENILRGTSPSAVHARKTHCPWGHEYTPDNTTIRANGARRCKACREAANRALALCVHCDRPIHRASLSRHVRREHRNVAV